MKSKFITLCLLVTCIFTFSVSASAVNFEDVPAADSIIDVDYSVGYSHLFDDVPFKTNSYLIIQANSMYYLVDVPMLNNVGYTIYDNMLYTTSNLRYLACDTGGNVYTVTFAYNTSEVTIRRIGDNFTSSSYTYSIVPAVYTYTDGDNNVVSIDLYSEMGFIPNTEFSVQTIQADESYLSVYLACIIFALFSIFAVVLIRGRKS